MESKNLLIAILVLLFSYSLKAEQPATPSAMIEAAKSAELQGNYSQAIEYYRSAMEYKEVKGQAIKGLGHAYLMTNEIDEAKDVMSGFIQETNPFDLDVRIIYAEILEKKGDYAGAHKQLDIVDNLRKSYAPSWERRGYIYFDEKNFSSAVDYFSKYLNETPSNLKTRHFRAQAYAELGQFAKGVDDLKFLTNEKPNAVEFYIQMADYYFKMKKFKDCESKLRYAMKMAPTKFEVYAGLGDVLVAQKKDAEAIFFYKKAIELNPTHLDTGNKLGKTYMSLKNWVLAEEEFNRELRLNTSYAPAAQELLNTWEAQGFTDKMGYFLKSYISKYPEQKWAVIKATKLFSTVGEFKFVKEAIKNCLKENENDTESMLLAAYVYYKTGETSDALGVLKVVEKKDADNPFAKYNMAIALDSENKLDKAIDKYKEVSDKANFHYKAQVNLALGYEKLGKLVEAKDILKSIKVTGEVVAKIKAKISQWEKQESAREPSAKSDTELLTPYMEMELP